MSKFGAIVMFDNDQKLLEFIENLPSPTKENTGLFHCDFCFTDSMQEAQIKESLLTCYRAIKSATDEYSRSKLASTSEAKKE